jgi:inositol-hexakisphosphate/diphosphoinositol-pentakisphosphate 1-kinase
VKLPKTFLAVNLSDAFSFQEKPQSNDGDTPEAKAAEFATMSNPQDPGNEY